MSSNPEIIIANLSRPLVIPTWLGHNSLEVMMGEEQHPRERPLGCFYFSERKETDGSEDFQ
jgi:hypothetical protein